MILVFDDTGWEYKLLAAIIKFAIRDYFRGETRPGIVSAEHFLYYKANQLDEHGCHINRLDQWMDLTDTSSDSIRRMIAMIQRSPKLVQEFLGKDKE